MKIIKEYRGVPNGAIYPVDFAAGDDCPPELEQSAFAQGCLEGEPQAPAEAQTVGEQKTGIFEQVIDAVKSAITPCEPDSTVTD